MALKIVNPDPRYAPIKLVEPSTRGYLHIAAEVRPRRLRSSSLRGRTSAAMCR